MKVESVLPWLLLLPAVVPLVYADGLLYPYIALKTFLLRGLGIAVLASLAYLVLSNHPLYWERLRNKRTWIFGGLIVVAYLTSLVGVDFYDSFWSTFERGDGLLTLTILGVFFYAMLLFADATFIQRLQRWILWVATIVAAYTFLQWVQGTTGLDLPFIEEPRGRYGGTLGNAAYLASYLALTLFISIPLLRSYSGKWLKAVYASIGFQVLAILIAATRGTLLALAVAGFVALCYLAWQGVPKEMENIRFPVQKYARFGVISALIVAALFFVFREQLANVPIEAVKRVATMSISEGTVASRFFVWQSVFAQGLERPLAGVGAEHVDTLFNRAYDPTLIIEEWFDRSHNAFLDYFAQFGVVGLALYLALIIALMYRGMRLFRVDPLFGACVFLLALTYALQNFFVFDTAMTLWVFLSMFAAVFVGTGERPAMFPSLPRLSRMVPLGVAGALLLLLIPVSLLPLQANLLLASGYRYHLSDVELSVERMESGLALGTYAALEYGYNAYQMYTERQVTMLKARERIVAYRYARDIVGKNYVTYPYDARTALYYAHILDLAPPEMPTDEDELRRVIAHAIELSPKHMQSWYLLANISIRKGDQLPAGQAKNALYQEGIDVLADYAALVPQLAEPRFVIATLYLTMGDRSAAKQWADEALPLYKPDFATAKRASRYYLIVEDWANAARFLKDVVRTEKTNYPLWYDLAKAEFLSGNREAALEIVDQLRVDAPGLVETDPQFLAALEQ